MKLTSIKDKLIESINDSITWKCSDTAYDSTSSYIYWEIDNEIFTPNLESIQSMQIRTLENLENEIN